MSVFVLDKRKMPLMPCSEKRGRKLLESGRAHVHRLMPFTIRLVDRTVKESALQPIRIKLDPGSRTTGIALVRDSETINLETGEIATTAHVLNLFELTHRGRQISEALTARRQMRRRRRSNLRYRAPRFLNRRNKGKGWLAPSLQHRVDTTVAWVARLQRLTPVTCIAQELVSFDMQQMENPEISGVEYQQGTLAGYELREYVLAKWGRKCAYCDAENVPLNLDHIHAKSKGGSNRASNFTLACIPCNQKKGAQDIRAFLSKDQRRLGGYWRKQRDHSGMLLLLIPLVGRCLMRSRPPDCRSPLDQADKPSTTVLGLRFRRPTHWMQFVSALRMM